MTNRGKDDTVPDYKRIYKDLLKMKYPEKMGACQIILKKKTIKAIDVIRINRIIFGKSRTRRIHRSYDKTSIMKILKYQHENNMTNTDLSKKLGISRSTITKWKRVF